MINKKDILKMVRHISKRSQGVPDRRMIHPHRDWFFGLLVFVVIVGAGGLYTVNTYNRFDTIDTELQAPVSGVVTYETALVTETLEYYRARNEAYKNRLTQSSPQPEPEQELESETDASASATEEGLSGGASEEVLVSETEDSVSETEGRPSSDPDNEVDVEGGQLSPDNENQLIN